MKKLLFPLILSFSTMPFASAQILGPKQINKQRMFNPTFEKLHSTAVINCGFFEKWDGHEGKVHKLYPLIQDFSMDTHITFSHYKLGDSDLKIKVMPGGERGFVQFEIDGIQIPTYLTDYNNIWLKHNELTPQHNELIDKFKLREINCSLDMARNEAFEIKQKNLHVSMHPYAAYDLDGESDPVVEEYLNSDMPQLLVLDDINQTRKAAKENYNDFIDAGHVPHKVEIRYLSLPKVAIPENIPTRVGPMGIMNFKLTQPEHEITYTGGNYNFCILNNNRKLMHALFDSPASKKLRINYVTSGMVLQGWSLIDTLSFTKKVLKKHIKKSNFKYFKYSNLSSNIFSKMQQEEGQLDLYLDSHFDHLRDGVLALRKQHFGTLKIIREGIYSSREETLHGTGEGDYTIIFNYI